MTITVQAPNRIDLAGGTTDIYPLCLFMDGGFTVNVSISVMSTAVLDAAPGPGIRLISEDLGLTVEASGLEDLPLDGPLGLVGRAVRNLAPEGGLTIRTRNMAPQGSGLGASSALLVALLKGLFRLRDFEVSPRALIDLAADLEASCLGVPTGKQDYVAAVYGGFSAIDFRHGGFVRETVADDSPIPEAIEKRVILAFTGANRFSGMNNWEVTKRYIDNTNGVREALHAIRDVAVEMRQCLLEQQWDDLAVLVRREWELRRNLAPGVTTDKIEQIMAAAVRAGAIAGKVCGAGGGGCMITIAAPERREAVKVAMKSAGAVVMPFRVHRAGVRVTQEPKDR